jgi:hypothetical protein
MTKKTIIGLTGYAGTGKDTVRQILEQRHSFCGFAFADPIRGMLRELLTSNGIDDRFIDDRDFKEVPIHELGVSYRHMAQTLGTEWGRSLAPDFWLRIAGAYMADVLADGEIEDFVVSDVRFANEAEWIREQGGVIWRIERVAAVPVRAHASEAEIYHIVPDYVINNNSTIESLDFDVRHALAQTVDLQTEAAQ